MDKSDSDHETGSRALANQHPSEPRERSADHSVRRESFQAAQRSVVGGGAHRNPPVEDSRPTPGDQFPTALTGHANPRCPNRFPAGQNAKLSRHSGPLPVAGLYRL